MSRTGYIVVLAALVMGCAPASRTEVATSFEEDPAGRQPAATRWLTDFEAAKRDAAKREVPILADFSGSDWCRWCMKLDEEVFRQTEFAKYAKDNLVLFLADFPSRKKQTDEVRRQNKALADKFGIKGYPTVLLLDADGKVLVRTGYMRGGAEKYVEHLKEILGVGV